MRSPLYIHNTFATICDIAHRFDNKGPLVKDPVEPNCPFVASDERSEPGEFLRSLVNRRASFIRMRCRQNVTELLSSCLLCLEYVFDQSV